MSASNEWEEYHLTPIGWVHGSSKMDHAYLPHDPPADRVLTIRAHDYVASTFSGRKQWIEEVWRSDDATSVALLRERFNTLPKACETYGSP